MQTLPTEAYSESIVARRVIHRGIEYGLSLVVVRGTSVSVTPFERETASTTFHSGTLRILRRGAYANDDWHRDGDSPMLVRE